MSLSQSNIHNASLERRAREIAEAFDGHWRGQNGMCRCPAHDDRTPSLAIGLGKHAILFHCFAGCSSADVMAALARHGIEPRELFDGSTPPARCRSPESNTRSSNIGSPRSRSRSTTHMLKAGRSSTAICAQRSKKPCRDARIHGWRQARAGVLRCGRHRPQLSRRPCREKSGAPGPLPARTGLAPRCRDPGAGAHQPHQPGLGAIVPPGDDGRTRRATVHLDDRTSAR